MVSTKKEPTGFLLATTRRTHNTFLDSITFPAETGVDGKPFTSLHSPQLPLISFGQEPVTERQTSAEASETHLHQGC